jgi:hypothetical protein
MVVVVGVICEVPEPLHAIAHRIWARTRWYTQLKTIDLNGWERLSPELVAKSRHLPNWAAAVSLIGWIFVAVGVAGEGIAEFFVDDAETQIRSFDEALLVEAQWAANSAATAAFTANKLANESGNVSRNAESRSARALQEADSFESDIKSAKELATDAESKLRDATKRADNLTAALKRLTTPRSLTDSRQLHSSLTPFKDTTYMFTGVCGDSECVDLLRKIDNVLGTAGWRRIKSPHAFPGLLLWGDRNGDDGAGFDFGPGITITVHSTTPISELNKLLTSALPRHVQAAIALNLALASNVSPSENTGREVDVQTGSSTVVSVSVGRKPVP